MTRPLEQDRQLIRDAMDYQSSPDRCSAVYMGGIAIAAVCHAIRFPYGEQDEDRFNEALNAANRKQITGALKACAHTIRHMRKHPMKRCKSCGQVIAVG